MEPLAIVVVAGVIFSYALIARARSLLGADGYEAVFGYARDTQVAGIRKDLSEFGVEFDRWFSERSLADSGDKVVITMGMPVGAGVSTNMLKIHDIR